MKHIIGNFAMDIKTGQNMHYITFPLFLIYLLFILRQWAREMVRSTLSVGISSRKRESPNRISLSLPW